MEQARLRHDSDTSQFFQALAGFAIAVLVMVGVSGTLYNLIAPGGWFAQLFGRSLAGGLAALLAFMLMGLCAWLTRGWIPAHIRKRYAEVFAYLFAGAGALYAAELIVRM